VKYGAEGRQDARLEGVDSPLLEAEMLLAERSVLVENLDHAGKQSEPGVDRLQGREVLWIQRQTGAKERANLWCEVTDVGGEKSRCSRRGGACLACAEHV